MGPTREIVFRHEFAGGNYLLGNKDKVMERLKSAATLTLNLDKKDPQPGDKVKISVKLTNSGAGHKLPTGLTYVRDTRLLIQAVDDTGKAKTLYEERFDTVHEDAAGKHDRTVPVWRAVKIFSDNRLAPFESRDYSETYTIPKDAAAINWLPSLSTGH